LIHPYCIRREGEPGPSIGLTGVDDATVELLEAATLGIWFSPGEDVRPTPENLARHDRVIRTALATATPLPLRFGARLAAPEDLEHTLREKRDEYLRLLDRVKGCVEIGLRIPLADHPGGPGRKTEEDDENEGGGEGRRYMRRLRAERDRQRLEDEAADRSLSPVLAALPRPVDMVREVVDGSVVVASLLVRKPDVPGFREAFSSAREAAEGLCR